MSAYIFTIKQNDRRPKLTAQFKNADDTPIDLSDADSVTLIMTKNKSATPKVNRGACNIDDILNGTVSYTWQPTDTDTVGTYKAEFEITWTTGITQTMPEDDYIKVVVVDDLA